MGNLSATILSKLADGPRWARSFQHVKPRVRDLVADGLVERVKPHGERGANMLALTASGAAALRERGA
jgi:DNA-binding MarR family transcriptional regulator